MMARGSITHQVLVFALLICASVLLPVGGGLTLHYYTETEARLAESLATTTRLTAANSIAALEFDDSDKAKEILSALHLDPLISSAIIYDKDDRVFATYQNPFAPSTGTASCTIELPIERDTDYYGRLVVAGHLEKKLHDALLKWGLVYAIAFLLAGSSVIFIARRFQLRVTRPLIDLAAMALKVAKDRDFTTRAPLSGCTEIAHLAATLNLSFCELEQHQKQLDTEFDALEQEVRERMAAEHALRQNQQTMNRLAREAGMAEVASGVIHNIGNTLTSISISSDLVASRLANSRRRSIETLNKLVDPASVLTTPIFTAHAEGPELRTLLGQITDALASDLEETTRLVGILQAGNSHLKSIVSTQQSLARNRHMLETFVVREALQEALLLARTLSRHHAPIDECPHSDCEVYADRGLVVHILLNLLINAHDAIGALRPATPRITLSIAPAQDGLVSITVSDNGEGISSEKLLSIFTYGFTTKAKGNGFGLHNSANASRMMGGDLLVTSPGPGQGASFTLRLPSGIPAPTDFEN
jgi:signal transduction histidine kinase